MQNVGDSFRIEDRGLPVGYSSVNTNINRIVYENIEFNLWRLHTRLYFRVNQAKNEKSKG